MHLKGASIQLAGGPAGVQAEGKTSFTTNNGLVYLDGPRDSLTIGKRANSTTRNINGTIKRLCYFPEALTQDQLNDLLN